ncbi:MAG: hypothetical protein CM1200mP41_36770 [Gammaproteobacteria bacterium]|nr:MAG: hypothetical protein CM1200mP41_36770 [Gammaproteobacteria bacterium]
MPPEKATLPVARYKFDAMVAGVVDPTVESEVLARSVRTLIGFGPRGLTPSGDDFLAGMLIALSVCGAKHWQHQLANAVQGLFRGRGRQSNPFKSCNER